MAVDRIFRIPEVVIHQTLDGEAVVINLDNGRYYAFNDCGSLVWNALADGHSANAVARAFAPDSTADHKSIERFVDELLEQGLIQQTSTKHAAPPPTPLPSGATGVSTAPFAEPRMEIYTDMERLLPLDPLHEVDERGWPNRKARPS